MADYVAKTRGRVAYQGSDKTVVMTGHRVNHVLHLILTVITSGLWLIPWIIISVTGGEKAHTITVSETGEVTVVSDKTKDTGTTRWPRVGALALIVIAVVLVFTHSVFGLFVAIVLAASGVTLMVMDIRAYGTARTVQATDKL